jgi:LysM domain
MNKSALTLVLITLGIAVSGCASTKAAKEEAKEQNQAAQTQPMAQESAPAPTPTTRTNDSYNVVRGDNLWTISAKSTIYGNPYEWPLIYGVNRDRIRDPDLIYPGQTFTIDRNASTAEVDGAIQHAKTRGAWELGVVERSDRDYLAKWGEKLSGVATSK